MNEKVMADCMDTSIDWIMIIPIMKILLYMTHIPLSQHRQEPARVRTTDLINTFIVSWLSARERICSEPVLSKAESHCVKVTLYWKPASKHSDKACGPTGLEEMVYTDPVCSQVGFPSSGLLNSASSLTEQCTLVGKKAESPSHMICILGCFYFPVLQLSSLMWPSHHPWQPDLWHHLHPTQWAHQDRIRYIVTQLSFSRVRWWSWRGVDGVKWSPSMDLKGLKWLMINHNNPIIVYEGGKRGM